MDIRRQESIILNHRKITCTKSIKLLLICLHKINKLTFLLDGLWLYHEKKNYLLRPFNIKINYPKLKKVAKKKELQ